MQDHSHRDHIGLRQWILKEIARCGADPISQPSRGNVLLRYGLDRGQVKTDALNMWMFFGNFDAEQSRCTADIAKGVVSRKIEFVGERFEVDARQAGHPVEEALELFRVGIQFIENVYATVLDFVL